MKRKACVSNVGNINLAFKLADRELGVRKRSCMPSRIPPRLVVPLERILDYDCAILSSVILGFTRDGRHLLAYRVSSSVGRSNNADVDQYTLEWWEFSLSNRLRKVAESPMLCSYSGESQLSYFETSSHLGLHVLESPDSHCFVCCGVEKYGSDEPGSKGVHISIVPSPFETGSSGGKQHEFVAAYHFSFNSYMQRPQLTQESLLVVSETDQDSFRCYPLAGAEEDERDGEACVGGGLSNFATIETEEEKVHSRSRPHKNITPSASSSSYVLIINAAESVHTLRFSVSKDSSSATSCMVVGDGNVGAVDEESVEETSSNGADENPSSLFSGQTGEWLMCAKRTFRRTRKRTLDESAGMGFPTSQSFPAVHVHGSRSFNVDVQVRLEMRRLQSVHRGLRLCDYSVRVVRSHFASSTALPEAIVAVVLQMSDGNTRFQRSILYAVDFDSCDLVETVTVSNAADWQHLLGSKTMASFSMLVRKLKAQSEDRFLDRMAAAVSAFVSRSLCQPRSLSRIAMIHNNLPVLTQKSRPAIRSPVAPILVAALSSSFRGP